MKSGFKNSIEALGLDYKKEVATIALINIITIALTIVLYFLFKQVMVTIVLAVAILVIDFYLFTRYSSLQNKLDKQHNQEFVSLLSYFEIFISNKKNVYNSLENLIHYSSPWMKEKLEHLLKDIDEDKTVAPFITFSNHFSNKIIQSVMLSIYQMVDQGESLNNMSQFDALFHQIINTAQSEKIKNKESSLESLNMLPLLGAGMIMLVIVFSILQIVGDMINVI